jgi:hypothetical protein
MAPALGHTLGPIYSIHHYAPEPVGRQFKKVSKSSLRLTRIGVTFERAQMYGETHERVSLDL